MSDRKNLQTQYRLRKVAGLYWLIDVQQEGIPYHKPALMNESGAHIWELLEEGLSFQQIAEQMSQEFGIELEEMIQDIDTFVQDLRKQGISL